MTYQMPSIFPGTSGNENNENLAIVCTDVGTQSPFMVIATNQIPDLHLVGTAAQCLPLYRYEKDGSRVENITNWGLNQFRDHYKTSLIQPEDIFHYVYAVLHYPVYRTKYELNLKREFPRVPFYENFQQWADWGKQLIDLHVNFEEAEPYELERFGGGFIDESNITVQESIFGENDEHSTRRVTAPKCRLKANKAAGVIEIDSVTTLQGIPSIAWDYKLGNRSALEWVLDQYKEKKPKDSTIAAMFNTYRFMDYKEQVIDLLR